MVHPMLDISLHSIFYRNTVIITTKNEGINVSVNDNALMFSMPEIQTKIKLEFRTQGWLTRALFLPLVIIHLFIIVIMLRIATVRIDLLEAFSANK